MITKMFAVYDIKAQVFGTPWCQPQTGAAVRMFSDLANDAQTTIHKHPSDYQLFQVGEYDDSTGVAKALVPAVLLGVGSDFIAPVAVEGVRALTPEIVKGE